MSVRCCQSADLTTGSQKIATRGKLVLQGRMVRVSASTVCANVRNATKALPWY
jgi:hypothetical protein